MSESEFLFPPPRSVAHVSHRPWRSTLIVLTEEEAQLRQAGIDELVLFKSYRETKVLIIDNLPLALSKKTYISSDAVERSKAKVSRRYERQTISSLVNQAKPKNKGSGYLFNSFMIYPKILFH